MVQSCQIKGGHWAGSSGNADSVYSNFITMTLQADTINTNATYSCGNNNISGHIKLTQTTTASVAELTTTTTSSYYGDQEMPNVPASDGIIWNVVIKSKTPTDMVMKSLNFWIQVRQLIHRHETFHIVYSSTIYFLIMVASL